MTLDAAQAKLLRTAARGRSRAELKRLFAAIRAHDDASLLAALAPQRQRPAKRRTDPLVRDLERILKPIMGPASEKAELLVEHAAKRRRRKLDVEAKGLADAARQLRSKFSDDQIREDARSLVALLASLHGDRETVV
jgi:hypothetical protein